MGEELHLDHLRYGRVMLHQGFVTNSLKNINKFTSRDSIFLFPLLHSMIGAQKQKHQLEPGQGRRGTCRTGEGENGKKERTQR